MTSHTYGIFMGSDHMYGDDCNPVWTMTNIARSLALVSPTGELRHMSMAQDPTGTDKSGYPIEPWQDRTLADDITWESSNEEVLTWWEGEVPRRAWMVADLPPVRRDYHHRYPRGWIDGVGQTGCHKSWILGHKRERTCVSVVRNVRQGKTSRRERAGRGDRQAKTLGHGHCQQSNV